MNVGKTLFAQVMEFVPLKTFGRIIDVAATHHVESTRLHGQDVQHNTSLPALTIAALYKSRWQVELFFKWIKQHLRIKRFLGTSENAVKTQIWCAVSTPVLIAIVKKELHLDASLYTCLQILLVSVFEM
jgi:hypothetical protein